ncbi:hypothetical protein PV10_01798 [Exophiala mesophila]|uniref:Hemerythrin-like domain-containing protein n=1 Tax=Exophiala mesophila TaxID=212818 RepID=A0A0D1ZUA7_EXOME|nr:uncharacterized protein PV10_01798 [Exophiala mesophila]KIV98117.1 hypothetical protein PV10_01798 [Exophiala mesophila]
MDSHSHTRSRSRSPSPTHARYSHLLYLSEAERSNYQTNVQRSASSSSRSIRSTHSANSSVKSHSSNSTHQTSVKSILSPRFADDHYPLITTIHPENIPASVPKSHAALWCARRMADIHNTIIRALNSSWNHAASVEPAQVEAFLHFNRIIFTTLDHHHKVEDDYMFPAYEKLLNRPGAMESNVKGHESFAEGLSIFHRYITMTKPDEFNGTTFRHIIESFAPELIQHLHDEIPTLASLHVLKSEDLMKIWKEAEHIATKDGSLYTDLPWTLTCQDKSFVIDGETSSFPDVPWLIEAVVRNWHAKRYADVWKFSPSDLHGQRRLMVGS